MGGSRNRLMAVVLLCSLWFISCGPLILAGVAGAGGMAYFKCSSRRI